jgi:hypothetical protein
MRSGRASTYDAELGYDATCVADLTSAVTLPLALHGLAGGESEHRVSRLRVRLAGQKVLLAGGLGVTGAVPGAVGMAGSVTAMRELPSCSPITASGSTSTTLKGKSV